MECVLGPSVDLLVWIMKVLGAERPAEMRPLQLPTCLRRIHGAALAGVVGPEVEPHLTEDQASKAGGSCGPNIRRAFDHLAQAGEAPRGPTDLWPSLLGPALGPIERHIEETVSRAEEAILERPGSAGGTELDSAAAALFADQSKAFERLGLHWFDKVLRGWNLPAWAVNSFGVMCQ